MITVTMPNNSVARKVLTAFKKLVRANHRSKTDNGWINVSTYTNCREQGFNVKEYIYAGGNRMYRTASFSENRNSDNIVVYCGVNSDFDTNTGIPNEETWRNAQYFGAGEYDKAAEYVYNWIVKGEKLTPYND